MPAHTAGPCVICGDQTKLTAKVVRNTVVFSTPFCCSPDCYDELMLNSATSGAGASITVSWPL
jgi:hypothetical protein